MKKQFFLERIPLWLKISIIGSIVICMTYLISFFTAGQCSIKEMTIICGINIIILFSFGYPYILITKYLDLKNINNSVEIIIVLFSILLTSFTIFAIIGYIVQKFQRK